MVVKNKPATVFFMRQNNRISSGFGVLSGNLNLYKPFNKILVKKIYYLEIEYQ